MEGKWVAIRRPTPGTPQHERLLKKIRILHYAVILRHHDITFKTQDIISKGAQRAARIRISVNNG